MTIYGNKDGEPFEYTWSIDTLGLGPKEDIAYVTYLKVGGEEANIVCKYVGLSPLDQVQYYYGDFARQILINL